jgi:hypothetical protein
MMNYAIKNVNVNMYIMYGYVEYCIPLGMPRSVENVAYPPFLHSARNAPFLSNGCIPSGMQLRVDVNFLPSDTFLRNVPHTHNVHHIPHMISDHFPDVSKMVSIGSGAEKKLGKYKDLH